MLTYSATDYTDDKLLEMMAADDRMAFDELYNRHWKSLFNSAYRTLKDREDSLDICQVVFLWFWEHRKTLKIKTSVQAYLWTAVKYKIANLIRNGKVKASFFEELKKVDVSVFVEKDLEIKELKLLIGQLTEQLPEKCKAVFKLSRDEQLSHRQIALKLGISEKTVDDHITRALKKLRGPLNRLAVLLMMI